MAGGTTTAKQVLWNLKGDYRCCVVKNLTKQTPHQLKEIYTYNDTHPKPLLVMLDNKDSDRCEELMIELQEEIRKMNSAAVDNPLYICVAIICKSRTAKGPFTKDIYLKQELSKRELAWFPDRYNVLALKFKEDKTKNMNPKFLISFNILKENFNKKYIHSARSQFTDGVVVQWEIKLMKMISFLNYYDTHFEPISVSCLDDLLLNKHKEWASSSQNFLQRNKKWEAFLSAETKVLLNVSSERNLKRNTVCVFNRLIAKEVLKRLMERDHQKTSDIMLELLDSQMFISKKQDALNLIASINRIVRIRISDDDVKQKFSLFVLDMQIEEGNERVVDVLQQILDVTEDSLTAQVLARFYTRELKYWGDAQYFARKAIGMSSNNSYLYHTYAQVYLFQLQAEMSDHSNMITPSVIRNWISLSMKSLEYFKKAELIDMEKEEDFGPNPVGFLSQLRTIEAILQGIRQFLTDESFRLFQSFLVNQEFGIPSDLDFLSEPEVCHLKSLQSASEEALLRLNDESVQMKIIFESELHADLLDVIALEKLKRSLDKFFESANNSCSQNSTDRLRYRYSMAKKNGGTHLNELLMLREAEGFGKLHNIYKFMKENVQETTDQQFPYLLTLVGNCTMLILEKRCPHDLEFNTLLSWCRELLKQNKPLIPGRIVLEPYLYFIMYNFPTEQRLKYNICSNSELKSAMKSAVYAFKQNYPKYFGQTSRKRRQTTLFFLGVNGPLEDIIHPSRLSSSLDRQSMDYKWQDPSLRTILYQVQGTLLPGGERVEFSQLKIQTCYPIGDRTLWQKSVTFYIGFSWIGPLAYGVSPVG